MKNTQLLAYLLFISIITTSSHVTYGMLGKIEKRIFLREVKRIGKKATLRQIRETKDPELDTKNDRCRLILSHCFTITTHVNSQEKDIFSQLVVKTIKEKEAKDGYIPKHIEKRTSTAVHITMPNNFLENYTRYWHKKNNDDSYIELISNFNDKKSLLDVLNNQE